jgi:DMSO/TMAO reductase YedYZ molybdopterin-dependent catalytic subunit
MNLIRVPRLQLTRRNFLQVSGISGMGFLLSSCGTPLFHDVVNEVSEPLNEKVETLLFNPQKPVPEFSKSDIQPKDLLINTFQDTPIIDQAKFRLIVDGDVNKPLNLSMADIQALPLTSMIIRHICVEGWSAIVQWGGIRLREIVALAQPKANVKFAYFKSADGYYESWDIDSALHPQTLLAYQKNGEPLPVDNGAPLRLASPVKLGYKQSKWVTQVTLISDLPAMKGFWEDQGYEWYGGL